MTQPASLASQEGQAGRALRTGYRKLLAGAVRDGEDLVSLDKSRLAEMLAQANQLQERVQRPREQAVDSEVFAHLTDRGVELAKKLQHGGKGHTAKDFLRRLKAKYVASSQAQDDGAARPEAFSWARMGEHVAKLFRPAPGLFCMVGPLDATPKLRKAPVRHARQQLGELVRPDEVQDLQEAEKQETDRNLDEVWGVLQQHGAVPLLELVLNHRSFAQTVENLFSVSFLVRDGKVSLTKSERGAMVTKLAPRGDDPAGAPTERVQFIINQTMDDWEEWKRYVDPADCLLKHRPPHQQQQARAAPVADADAGPATAPQRKQPAGRSAAPGGSGSKRKAKAPTRHATPPESDDEGASEEGAGEEAAPKRRKKGRKD